MGIRYELTGDIAKARMIAVDAARQFFILRNAMKFQGLKQLQRIVTYTDGSRMVCSSSFGIETARVFATAGGGEVVVKKAEYCWCGNVFAAGVVTGILGDYGDVGEPKDGYRFYPEYCTILDSYIKKYTGIRYRVLVCQKTFKKALICIPSDFAQYVEGDLVVVLFRGLWDGTSLLDPLYLTEWGDCKNTDTITCQACSAVDRAERGVEEADGSFIIIPATGGSDG